MGPATEPHSSELVSAVRQASWQFGILAMVGSINVFAFPDVRALMAALALTFAAVALVLRAVPARVWGPRTMLALTVLLFLALGASTWSAHERAIVTGPGFVLAFVWMGLHQRVRTILFSLPPAIATYLIALRLAGTPPELAGSAFVMIPVAALVGVVLSRTVADNRRAKAVIEAEERWRAAIMATLAHDVRAPLTSIMGALEILDDDSRTPASHRSLVQGASRQAGRILRLAAGLLEVERVEQGQLKLCRRELVLVDLVDDIAADQPTVPFVLDVPPGFTVWADRERLEQVLVNLVNNAVRHGVPPLAISASSDPSGVVISIRDHGAGVHEEDVPHLFEKFSSADHSPQSVGLGLWIVRLLTEAHGGSVGYEPAEPGASFVVRLPHAPGRETADYAAPVGLPGARPPGRISRLGPARAPSTVP